MSLVAIVIISVITNYTGKLIIECLYEKPFNDQSARGVRLRNSYASIGKLVSSSFCLILLHKLELERRNIFVQSVLNEPSMFDRLASSKLQILDEHI